MIKKFTTILLVIMFLVPAVAYAKPRKRYVPMRTYVRLAIKYKQQKELNTSLGERLQIAKAIIKLQDDKIYIQGQQLIVQSDLIQEWRQIAAFQQLLLLMQRWPKPEKRKPEKPMGFIVGFGLIKKIPTK